MEILLVPHPVLRQKANKLKSLSGLIIPGTELSISKTVEIIVNEKAKKYNGKIQRAPSKQ